MHTCEICGRRYRSNLSMFYRIHTNQKAYTCKVCQKDYNNRSLLKKHHIHKEDKTLPCDMYQPNPVYLDQKFLEGHNTLGVDPHLSFESEIVLENMDISLLNSDCRLYNLEDYILPAKPIEIGKSLTCASTPKVELILTTDSNDYFTDFKAVQSDNMQHSVMKIHSCNTLNNTKTENSLPTVSILESLLTKPVRNLHKECLPTSVNNRYQVPTTQITHLRNLLINHVKNKNAVSTTSILESLLTKPLKTDQKKYLPVASNNTTTENISVHTSLLKSLLLASKREAKNKCVPARNSQDNQSSLLTVRLPVDLSTSMNDGKSIPFLDTAQHVENKVSSTDLFKIVNVVSLAPDFQFSSASKAIKPDFRLENDASSPSNMTENSAEVLQSDNLLSTAENNLKFCLPPDIFKFKRSVKFEMEKCISVQRKRNLI